MFSSFRNHSPQLVWKRKGPTEISSLAPNISPFAETFRNDRTSISNARLKDQKYHVEKLNRKLGLCPCFVGSIVRQTRLGKRNVCWIDAFSTVFKTKTPIMRIYASCFLRSNPLSQQTTRSRYRTRFSGLPG